jgi:hypothetical protein
MSYRSSLRYKKAKRKVNEAKRSKRKQKEVSKESDYWSERIAPILVRFGNVGIDRTKACGIVPRMMD